MNWFVPVVCSESCMKEREGEGGRRARSGKKKKKQERQMNI